MSPAQHASALADLLQLVFIAMWFVGVGGWAWAFWHFMPMWRVGFKEMDQHRGYPRKVLLGVCVFLGAFATGAIAMLSIEALGLPHS
jgi:hypothetical protein